MEKRKIGNLYGCATLRPEYAAEVILVTPPLWKRLWYGFTNKLYEFFLIFMFAICFTVATQPQAVYGLIQYLVTS